MCDLKRVNKCAVAFVMCSVTFGLYGLFQNMKRLFEANKQLRKKGKATTNYNYYFP